ncbi:MAG: hypothetical protein H0T62_06270 [Parachlamydiaceae bacterium]|nr:hypothetical protein [Parachlamydiaceae bacterium]
MINLNSQKSNLLSECSFFSGFTSLLLEEEEDDEENFSPYKNHPIFERFKQIDDEAKNQLYLLFDLQLKHSGLKQPFWNCIQEIEEQITYLTILPREIKKLHETTLLMSANLLIARIKDISCLLANLNKKLEGFLKSLYTTLPSINMFRPKIEKIRKKYGDIEKEWIVPVLRIKEELSLKLAERSKWDIKTVLNSKDLSIFLSCFDCLQIEFQEKLEHSLKQTVVIKEIKIELDENEKEMNKSKNAFLYSFKQLDFQITNASLGTRFESYINPATVTNICFAVARTFGFVEDIKPYTETSNNALLKETSCNDLNKNSLSDDLKEDLVSKCRDNKKPVHTLGQKEKLLMLKFLDLVEEKIYSIDDIPENHISQKEMLYTNPILIDLIRLLPPLPKEIKGLWNIALQTLLTQFINLTELPSIDSNENETLIKLVKKYKDEKEKIKELKKIIPLLPHCPPHIQELINTVLIFQQIQFLEKKKEMKITPSNSFNSENKDFFYTKISNNMEHKDSVTLMPEVESEEISQLQEELKERIILYHRNLGKLFPREITRWVQVTADRIRIPTEYFFSFLPEILNLYQSLPPSLSETKRGNDQQLQTKVANLVTQIQEGEQKFAALDGDIQKDLLSFTEIDEAFIKNLNLLATLDMEFQTELASLNKLAVHEKGSPEKSDFIKLHLAFINKLGNIIISNSYQTLHQEFIDDLEPKDPVINDPASKVDYQISHSTFMKLLQESLRATYLNHIQQFQLKITNFDKSYQEISRELINPMNNSNSNLLVLLNDRIQLDQSMNISKNCLDIIATHFDIHLEELHATFKAHQEFTTRCKESKKTLYNELQNMKKAVDNFKMSLNKFIYLTKYKISHPTDVRSEQTFLRWYPLRFNYLNGSFSFKSPLETQNDELI